MAAMRGEIYMASLDPVFGREIGGFKMRPVLVVSINILNNRTRLVTVVPGTSAKGERRDFDNEVTVEPDPGNGLVETTIFQCHQIRAIEQGRLTQKPKGRLSKDKLRQLERAMAFSLGLSLERTR